MQIPTTIQKINNRLGLVTPGLIRKKPLFLARILFRTLSQRFWKTKRLRSVLFHTHYKCNLNCQHCYEKNFYRTNEKLLTLAEKKKVIADCLKLGVVSFDFVGGETVLDPELPELVKACRPARTYITLATNGYGFTEEKIRYLLHIGIDKMNISIDSWYPQEHDEIRRKKGSHQHAFGTLELCKKVGMGFHITIFVYKDSTKTDGFKKLVEYAIKNRVRVAFKAALPLGAWEAKHDKLISADDKDTIFRLYQKYPFLKMCNYGNKNGGCPAFDEVITITAYGDVLPCNGIHISFGNVRNDDLQAIVDKGRRIKYFNGRYDGCPPAEDKDFIESYLSKTYNAEPYPIKAAEVFEGLKNGQDMGLSWRDEVVLIAAGSYEGVSKALALKAEQLKATVIIVARTRNKDGEIFKRVGNTFIFPFDFQEIEKVPELYKSIVRQVKKTPTVLINDIRYQVAGFVQNTPVEFYEECFKANALFFVALIQCMLPDMIRQKKGVIANIMSAVVYHSYPGVSAYYASKSYLDAIHESLKAELDGLPVKTLYIRPGGYLLNYWKNTTADNRIRDFKYPAVEHLRDTEYVVSKIFKAIEEGKEEINVGTLKDRTGYHLNYWAPAILDRVIAGMNRQLIKKRPDSQVRI